MRPLYTSFRVAAFWPWSRIPSDRFCTVRTASFGVSILVPVVAMVSGALMHAEPLGPVQWLAMVCSVAALSLVLFKPSQGAPAAEVA